MAHTVFPDLNAEAARQLPGLASAGLVEPHQLGATAWTQRSLGKLSLQEPSAEGTWDCGEVEGEVPREIHGDLFRVCAGQRANHGVSLRHRFDGDGFLVRYTFREGKVSLAGSYVDTPERTRELRSGRMLYDEFGTLAPMQPSAGRKNQPSVNVIRWDGRLLGLSEGGHPSEIDPTDLGFRSYWDFHGTLPANVTFTAHLKFDPQTGLGYAFGIRRARQIEIVIFRMECDGTLAEIATLPQDSYYMVHDMLLGTEHLILVVPPVRYDLEAIMSGEVSGADALRFMCENPMSLIVLRKDGAGIPQVIEQPSGMVFHHGNLHEADGVLTFDSLTSPDDSALKVLASWNSNLRPQLTDNQLVRLKLDLNGSRVLDRRILEAGQEFPRFDERFAGRAAACLYMLERNRADDFSYPTLVRHNVFTGRQDKVAAAPQRTLEEVVFVARNAQSAEGEGWLIGQGYDANRNENFLEVRDAVTLDLAARVWTGQHFPLGFHGNFYPHA